MRWGQSGKPAVVEIDVALRTIPSPAAIEMALSDAGVNVTLRGTLRAYPGCHHWHLKQPGMSGTLELTFWPETGRIWFKIAANRHAEWMEAAMRAIENRL